MTLASELPARTPLARLIDAILPPRCLGCGGIVDAQGHLCPSCWSNLTFIAEPLCARCGVPFPVPAPPDTLCGQCLAEPPRFAAGRAALVYDDGARPLILRFKHGDRTHAALTFAPWLARAGARLLAEADVIVPVPLHRWRLFARRFNQAALLAQAVGRAASLPVAVDALSRVRPTPSQGGLGRTERRVNVRGAFAVRRPGAIRDARVVLVDDVVTTGATADVCAQVLLGAGARQVAVLALARAVRVDP